MSDSPQVIVGRNEPCPCGSGKKYKRCHGVDAPPVLSQAKQPQMPEGFDPSKVDPAAMNQFAAIMGKMPKQHLNKLQNLMQKAMAGHDVSAEAKMLESIMPPELMQMASNMDLTQFGMSPEQAAQLKAAQAAAQNGGVIETTGSNVGDLSEAEARRIVEQAALEGKVSQDEAQTLLEANAEKKSVFSKLFKK